ncbi:hypothetical protein H7J08_22215 [Mycobacterium frederiksbergense]|uniref:Uncharacterized protein n=1 Tax=Mycolicibacterium frederiksbergense TaxID=117567 RepID=A0A6H0S2K1_9MYCO|nr:hypothetical protein [Mycolicibacterium frederiksbergense]MCV7047352.1 hypothetical protein [Mycolicibacterium frederiksbergense]QIV80669.1 hypothetical protein EXE63_07060 [Mycolicibacterium frederiksbergense]
MLTLIETITGHADGAALPVMVYCSAVSVLAFTAAFAPSRRRRDAALRALRALLGRSDDDDADAPPR